LRAVALHNRRKYRRRRLVVFLVVVVLLAVFIPMLARRGPTLSPLRARIVAIATSQLGYKTHPTNSYCNRYSAYWDSGASVCDVGLLSEQWCADFAEWVWKRAGVHFNYGFYEGEMNSSSYSIYQWGILHHRWHAAGSHYVPQPGDIAIYGLDVGSQTAQHVAVVTSYSPGQKGPNVVNGDGSRTGFSVVEVGIDQWKADVHSDGARLSGYVAASAEPRKKARGE